MGVNTFLIISQAVGVYVTTHSGTLRGAVYSPCDIYIILSCILSCACLITPPDTWSCPTLGLAMLRQISPELVLFTDLEFRTYLGTSVLLHAMLMLSLNRAYCPGKVSIY